MANDNDITTRFKVDVSDLKKGISEANQAIKLANAEFKAAAAGMDDWGKSADGLKAKISQLNKLYDSESAKLKNYKDQIARQKQGYEEASKAANTYRAKLQELANNGVSKTSAEYKKYQSALTAAEKAQAGYQKEIDKLTITMTNQQGTVNALEKDIRNYGQAINEVGQDTSIANEGFTVMKGVLANLATQGINLAIDAFKSLGSAIKNTAKEAIESYASYEQLVGGIETLFKDSSDKVQNYANDAYKTAGVSANDYMDQITSFSASLISSLGGDTEKAAEMGNMAIIDMADNANKMGTDLGSIQHAYQGFAKQNYTMLDNLKLGYGGTKTEMERLIQDANKVKEANGEMADLSINSFADVTEAIHIIQTEMGITGTTAKEAATTIEGSAKSMKAAWQNLLTGMGQSSDVFSGLYDKFTDGLTTLGDNLVPILSNVLTNLGTLITRFASETLPQLLEHFGPAIEELAPKIGKLGVQIIQTLVISITNSLPTLIKAGAGLIQGILQGFSEYFPTMWNTAAEITPLIIDALVESIPILIDGAVNFFSAILEALPTVIENILKAIPKIVDSVINALIIGIPALIDGAVKLFMAIVEAIPKIIPIIIENIPKIINSIINGLIKGVDALVQGAVQLLMAIVDAIPILIETLVPQIPTIIDSIINALIENTPALLEGAITLFMALVEAIPTICMALMEAVPKIITSILDALFPLEGDLGGFFTDIWENIQDIFAGVGEWFSNLFSNAWDGIKGIWDTVANWFNDYVVQPIKQFFEPLITFFTELWDVISGIAKGTWKIIKQVWEVVSTWFNDNVITPVKNFFTGLWTNVSNAAKNAWNKVKEVWDVVSNWFKKNIVTPVSDFFSGMWDKVKKGAKSAWDGITSVFGKVKDWFQDKFSAAWNAVKKVFSTGGKIFDGIKDGIVSAFKKVVNAIIGGINKVIAIPFNSINSVLNKIRGIEILGISPFSGLWKKNPLSVPQIPLLAQGGVLRRGQIGLLEGSGAEAVVPLENNPKWIRAVASDMVKQLGLGGNSVINSSNLSNSNVNNFTQIINAPKQPSRIELYRQTRNLLNFVKEEG